MAGRNFLFIPGPTNVPERILNAMHISQEDMRAFDFPNFTLPLFRDLKKIFKSKDGQVFIFPASGTGGWEAAITNTLSPGDKVLASGFGHFSNLFIDLCQRQKMDVQALEVDWGEGVPVEKYADILKKDKNYKIKAVLATHNETATGVTSDVPRCARRWMTRNTRPCSSSMGSARSRASISAWTNGAWTWPSPDRRRASCCRPASPSFVSARKP